MSGHVIRFHPEPDCCDARCTCGWDAHSTDVAGATDAAERHAFETGGSIELAGLPAVSA